MKAMVLAAGLGTRLRPITDHRPKALVEVGGRTLLEITLERLRQFGITEVIVNVHHFADMVLGYLQTNNNFGMRIEVSREDDLLLDTGGGLKKAAWFFREDPGPAREPFILHNVDVISNVDLHQMAHFHRAQKALVTLAVQERDTSRHLLFDQQFLLCGRHVRGSDQELAGRAHPVYSLGFTGIHVISRQFLDRMNEEGTFSIIDSYLRVAREGEKIVGFRVDGCYWRDLGRLDDLKQAEEDLKMKAHL